MAMDPLPTQVICDCRSCACGAVALGAFVHDSDEIIDDAINIFGVTTKRESAGYDSLLLRDIVDSGVDVREGVTVSSSPRIAMTGPVRYLWFRRRKPEPS